MALRLSDDEWRYISDMLQSFVLSHVCRKTWTILRRRHLSWDGEYKHFANKVTPLRGDKAVHTLCITCPNQTVSDLPPTGLRQPSPPVHDTSALAALILSPRDADDVADDDCVQALGTLWDTPSLASLTLDVAGNHLGIVGAQALATLKDARTLTTITLGLRFNQIKDSGAQALASLKDAPSLTTLTLDLEGNQIGAVGAEALANLKDTPSLTNLTLGLRFNQVGNNGAQSLSALWDAPLLKTLALTLQNNQIGDLGAIALARRMEQNSSLKALTLHL